MTIGIVHFLSVGAILFTLGVLGIFINRKNVIVILMSIELMLLAVNINLVAFSAHLNDIVGQVFALFVLTVAAAEGRYRPRDPGRLLPQPWLDRGRRRQHDAGLRAWVGPTWMLRNAAEQTAVTMTIVCARGLQPSS
jgi:NADH-quinone oxidoreductase subunit K